MLRALLSTGLWFLLLFAAEAEERTLHFIAAQPDARNGLQLLRSSTLPLVTKSFAGIEAVQLPPNRDYYRRTGFSLAVTRPFPADTARVFLVLEQMDTNIGVIQIYFDSARPEKPQTAEDRPAYTNAASLVGYTCLGTGKARLSVFRLDRPAFRHRQEDGADIRIEGIQTLVRATLQDTEPTEAITLAKKQIPLSLTPRLRLSRPMELVTTVGADASDPSGLDQSLKTMQELAPLAQVLGFNGFESYVKWNFVEPQKDRFDWSFYDALVQEGARYGLRWFPLLIVGSAYSLPDWYFQSPENEGFVCLEHGIGNPIQTIFCENQTPHVRRFLKAFGAHYEPTGRLLGVRLGPSGNYGESQYPAGGNWGYKGKPQHIHIGWWAGDRFAADHFRRFLKVRYPSLDTLNQAWEENYSAWEKVVPFLPQFAESKRKRKDMVDWYMGAMTDWCERWALWARESMPQTGIYQSAGGWGFVESGTDFTEQTRSMTRIQGGVRSTNETDSYSQNFYATRMLSSAARFYQVPLGAEPAGFGSARGMVARLYNILVNNGQHLFYYQGNMATNDQWAEKWLKLAPLLDRREEPFVEIAVLYPDSKSILDDGVFRNLYASSFNQRVVALRPHLDFDFCSERMILDGALSRYKALVVLWSDVVEKSALETMDQWVRQGGTVLYPYWARMPLGTVENDYSVYHRWLSGDTGKGKVLFYRGDREPPHRYADFVRDEILRRRDLDPRTLRMLRTEKPSEVYVSVLQSGTMAILNYNEHPVTLTVPGREGGQSQKVFLEEYDIRLLP